MTSDIRILNTGALLDLSRRLRSVNEASVRASMHRRIRRAAEPLRNDLQRTVRSLPMGSPGRSVRGGPSSNTRPLRATIAAAIRLSVRTTGNPGARVWIDRASLPTDLRTMPKHMNNNSIRHPVFGNKRRWVKQTTPPMWWEQTVRRHRPRMEREVERVLSDIRRRLE